MNANRRARPILIAPILLAVGLSTPAAAQLRIGGANASSPGVVSLPIYLRASVWYLGGVLLTVPFPASVPGISGSLASAGFAREHGIRYERSWTRADAATVFFWADHSSVPIQATRPYGEEIATLTLTIPPGLAAGTVIPLAISKSGSRLSGWDGRVSEAGLGWTTPDSLVFIGALWGDATGDGRLDVFDSVVLASYIAGNVFSGPAPFLGSLEAMNLNPAEDKVVDVFDLVLLAGHLVGNVPTLPVP